MTLVTDGSSPDVVRLAREAMATRFELVLHGDDPVRLRAAGEEALREITRLEDLLSFYRPAGALGLLNRAGASRWVRVPALLYAVLDEARDLHRITGGAFDPTVGPLMQCWGLSGGTAHIPTEASLDAARALCGFEKVEFDPTTRSVRFGVPGMAIDLGGIGKGFAIDEALEVLRDHSVPGALVHGGTSTVAALGPDESGRPWRIGIPSPDVDGSGAGSIEQVIELFDASLSVSEIRGKGFTHEDRFFGHIVDPRTGHPTNGAVLSAVRSRRATTTDALATALLVLGSDAGSVPAFRTEDVEFLAAISGWDGRVTFQRKGLTPAPLLS